MKKSILAAAILAAISAPAFANDSNWIFRGTVAHISPNDDSGTVLAPGDGVSVGSSTGIGLGFTYMMDKNWGVEVLLATPFTHDIEGTGDLAGLSIGETKHLPPTVSLTYSWGDTTTFHVGAGLNYTKFFQEDTSSALTSALGASSTSMKLDASTGLSVQFGFDTPINDDWNFTGGIYYKKIDTTADVDVYVDGALAATASVDVTIDPVVITLGVSTKF